jgi:glc operon protein GlcG
MIGPGPMGADREDPTMKTKRVLEIDDVARILAAARAEAQKNAWAVTITVVDDGGHALGLLRLDGASPASAAIATDKARTSALGRRESKGYEDMINGGRTAFVTVPLSGMLEGGVHVVVDGQCVGAVGVSGVKSDQDAQVAKAGIAALGG